MFSEINNGAVRCRTPWLASLLGGVALVSGWTANAHAATDLFLTWPGVIGPSTVQGHVGDIEITSYSQNASNTGQTSSGGGAGKAVCGQVTITKLIDNTSPVFLGMVLSGKTTAGPVTVTFAKSGEKDTTFYTVKLHGVVPTSITQSDSTTGDIVTETIVFSARQFQFSFTPQLANGSSGTPVTFGWDCQTNSRI